MILSHPVVSDPTDYKGLPFASKDGETANFLPFGELNRLINAKKPTVFFLDDLGQAPVSVQAAVMQLILARRINGHKVSDQVTFFAATNRKSDMAGVAGLLEPVKSRFASIIELEIDVDNWVQWGIQKGNMPTELMAFARFKPELLEKGFVPSKEIKNSPCPRTFASVGRLQVAGLPADMEYEAFMGAAGEGFATEYCAFLKMYRNLPDLNEIVKNPKGIAIPTAPDVKYAMGSALAAKMDDKNIAAIMVYLERMPGEVQVTCMKEMKLRSPQLMQTKTFIEWATKNSFFFTT